MCYNLTAIMTVLEQNRLAAVPKKKQKLLSLRMPAKSDRAIQGAMIVLSVYGLLMIASASMGLAVNNQRYLLLVVLKQIVFLAAGYYAMCFFARRFSLKYLQSSKFPPLAIGMGFALMACLVFPEVKGARAWIRVPVSSVDISIQPSEFAKIMTYLIIAAYCGDVRTRYPRGRDIWKRPLIFIFSYLIIIAAFQSDAGSAAVIVLIAAFCMLIPANKQLKPIQGLIAGLLILGIVFFLFLMTDQGVALIEKLPLKEYQKNRFLSSINPFVDRYNTGYQLVNGLISFASGGWTGLGFGNSVRKYTNFPAANTDFILAIVVEEMGLIGFLLIFIPYLIIVIQLFRYAMKMRSEKGRIILVGTALYLVIHCLFNIGGVTGLIPLTGVPLLMISSGGSSTLSFMSAIGIAQAVISAYRRKEIQ